jgi:hypothetical protein
VRDASQNEENGKIVSLRIGVKVPSAFLILMAVYSIHQIRHENHIPTNNILRIRRWKDISGTTLSDSTHNCMSTNGRYIA